MDLPTNPKKLTPTLSNQAQQQYNKFPQNIKDFYNFHGVQMIGSRFPMKLVQELYGKLAKAVSDIGEFFQIVEDQVSRTWRLRAKKDIKEDGGVWVVQHAITFRYPDLRRLLTENPSLIGRLGEILKYWHQMKPLPMTAEQVQAQNQADSSSGSIASKFTQIQFDNMDLTELTHLQFPQNTVTLSLIGNQLTNEQELLKKMQYLELKVLWLNGNPMEQSEHIAQFVKNKTKIQIFNSCFTSHCTQWGLKFVQKRNIKYAFQQSPKNIPKLNLDGRNVWNINLDILSQFTNLHDLSIRGHEIQDETHRQLLKKILQNTPKLRTLQVDFQTQLIIFSMFRTEQLPSNLASRLLINGHSLLSKQPTHLDFQIDAIEKDIFKIAGCYRLASSQKLDQTSIWYVNDQIGSAIQHADQGNVKLIPFLFAEDNKMGMNMWAYSVIWPIKGIKAGEFVYRDYLNGYTEERQRSSRLAIWYEVPMNFFMNRYNAFEKQMKQLQKQAQNKLINFYKDNTQGQRKLIKKRSDLEQMYPQKRRLITDMDHLIQHTKHKQIQFVKNLEQAQIVWLSSALDEETWPQYKDKFYINQFPFQASVVLKHNLAETVQTVLGNTPFLMRTYNLEKELPEFIGDYQKRVEKGQDNLWILKPPNMARSMDMIITDNLSTIIKNMQTGPKIAQKYISNPVLRQGRKVDLRYILLVKSVSPLTMFLYKHFWIRSSNNPYTVDRRTLSTYETQFTVMNYGQVSDFKQIKYQDFILDFQQAYPPHKYSQITQKIKKLLRNTFIAASTRFPQMQNDRSRAMYGIDIMIDAQSMEPKLLEITFSPDCKRACDYYPTFYDQVLEVLFLDGVGENMERVI